MEKRIEDYLHYYLGCPCVVTTSEASFKGEIMSVSTAYKEKAVEVMTEHGGQTWYYMKDVKPVLREISSETKSEMAESDQIWDDEIGKLAAFYLSRKFDIFGLIDAGLAINQSALLSPTLDLSDEEQRRTSGR